MKTSCSVALAALALAGCTSNHLALRRSQIRAANAAAARAPGAPEVEVVRESVSFWPTNDARPCAPVVKSYPASVTAVGEFDVKAPADITREQLERTLSTFACEQGWAAVTLADGPGNVADGKTQLHGTVGALVPELKAVVSAPGYHAVPREPQCSMPVLRTSPGVRAHTEVMTLFLVADLAAPAAQQLLQAHACAIGADAIIITSEQYDRAGIAVGRLNTIVKEPATRVTATAIVYAQEPVTPAAVPDRI